MVTDQFSKSGVDAFFRKPFDYPLNDLLVVLDLANNHGGSVEHGKVIIDSVDEITRSFPFKFVIKFQYRDLNSFIHPDFRTRFDDYPYIKRFLSTELSWEQFEDLTIYAKSKGFLTSATPFDEPSVKRVKEHGHNFIKVASASFTDWPLWEAIGDTDLPVLASTAGASIQDVDRVVAFLSNRERDFALMHCVAAYPTKNDELKLGRLDFMKNRYGSIPVGFSTHEDPNNLFPGVVALGMGAQILERHVGVPTQEAGNNLYSSDMHQLRSWLEAVQSACESIGNRDSLTSVNESEVAALRGLSRAAWAASDLQEGTSMTASGMRLAIPLQDNQISASDLSKYTKFKVRETVFEGDPFTNLNVKVDSNNEAIRKIVDSISEFITRNNVLVPADTLLEISHHYGVDHFFENGLAMFTVVNESYCKKLLVILPGQNHPEQFHELKSETFIVTHGTVTLLLDGVPSEHDPGSVVTILPGQRHEFWSTTGAVIEEISSTHFPDDSYYSDPQISLNRDRKTFVRFWREATPVSSVVSA